MKFIKNDGGRKDAGFKGTTGDCGVRALAITTGKPYREVYDRLFELQREFLSNKRAKRYKKSDPSPRNGLWKEVANMYIEEIGGEWVPCMKIGSGCKVHLDPNELPKGKLVCRVSKHFCAVIDGVLYDTYDSSRDGKRCVYGYWIIP